MGNRRSEFAKQLSGYTAAIGAAAITGAAADAEASPVAYDISANPSQVTTDHFGFDTKTLVLDPSKGPGSALMGVVADSANAGNGLDTSAPSDGALGMSPIFWNYTVFDDNSGSDKSGTEFGTLVASDSGVYDFIEGPSAQPDRPGHQFLLSSELIGDGYSLLLRDATPDGDASEPDDFPAFARKAGVKRRRTVRKSLGKGIAPGVSPLLFQLEDTNRNARVNEQGFRERLQVFGWGMETVPGERMDSSLSPDVAAPVELAALSLLSLGAVGLLAYRTLRRRRSS